MARPEQSVIGTVHSCVQIEGRDDGARAREIDDHVCTTLRKSTPLNHEVLGLFPLRARSRTLNGM